MNPREVADLSPEERRAALRPRDPLDRAAVSRPLTPDTAAARHGIESIQTLMEEQIATAPSLALHLVGRALDARADALGRGQEARMCRALATEAYRLRLAVVGAEYIESEGLE